MPASVSRIESIGSSKVHLLNEHVKVLPLAQAIATVNIIKGNDDAFTILNLDALYERFQLWKRELPQIELFYAMKCNSDETILRSLAALGVGFDCASKQEIAMVIRKGVSPDRIIYANPCKSSQFIEHAQAKGVTMMTFDSAEELEKISDHHKCPELLLRFNVSDPTATHPPSGKYGADPDNTAPELLKRAVELGVNIVGVSFHVGSGCNDSSVYRTAIQYARNLVNIGRQLGHTMKIVDVGGGFPGAEHRMPHFVKIASVIRSSLAEFFPDNDVRLIAEPGRYFAAPLCTLVTNVIAVKAVPSGAANSSKRMHYFINDGIYGSFNCRIFDHARPIGRPLFDSEGDSFLSTIWGPTCDSDDRVEDNKMMRALAAGDWLIYEEMGAYTSAAAFTFNGFPRATPIHVISDAVWKAIGLSDINNNIEK